MKRGCLYVDGNDLYTNYGMYVVDGGWNELIAYPPLKAVDKNDWGEMDGEEPDLSSPVLDTKQVQIKFAISSVFNSFIDFLIMISDGAYHTFLCASIKRTFTLRLTSQQNLEINKTLGFATMEFANDFPMKGYEYAAPVSNVIPCDDFMLDGHLQTEYGARILQGVLAEITKAPAIKQNLLQNSKYSAGAKYDGKYVYYKSKDIKVPILFRAETLEELWRNYDAYLFDLVRAGERTLWVNALKKEFPCYYKSSSVTDFFPTGRIWLQTSITLTLTRNFRI